ncbi:MAG: cupin domain-containing protein [Paracoccaceae bacterium]
MTKTMPPQEMLIDYATGVVSPGVAFLLAAHLDRVDESRDFVARYEQLGGALLRDEPISEVSDGLLASVFDRIDGGDADGVGARLDQGPLPQNVIQAVGTDFPTIPWRFLLPGVAEYEIGGFDGEKVSLLRARPGTGVPKHTHDGEELTLVLTGALQDGNIVYTAGEIAINDEQDDHNPRIIGDQMCYCLIVMTGGVRFTGRFGRALNFFADKHADN